MSISVFIADDHAVVCDGLRLLLEAQAAAAGGAQYVSLAQVDRGPARQQPLAETAPKPVALPATAALAAAV